jgi:hypothetical protein
VRVTFPSLSRIYAVAIRIIAAGSEVITPVHEVAIGNVLVVASRPPTLTVAFLSNSTPLGLISHTLPLASSDPSKLVALPLMRFSAVALSTRRTNTRGEF